MTCVCGSTRIARAVGKTNDMFFIEYNAKTYEGYVPDGIGIGGGDYIRFEYCLDCGRIQSQFPIPDDKIPSI